MNRVVKWIAIILCAGIVAPTACAQGPCSLRTLSGSYVTFERGSSITLDPSSVGVLSPAPSAQPSIPAWTALGIVPFVNVGRVTFTPEGKGDGYYWLWAGSVRATLESIPVSFTVTEMNEDCTGKFQYALANGAVVEERMILFDNGRQFRTIPTTLGSPGIPTLAWIGEGHRIGAGTGPVNSCGPQTSHGKYLMTCENIIRSGVDFNKAVADTFLLLRDVAMSGNYSGTLYEKFGGSKIELPVSGTIAVNPDCSFADTLNIPGIGSTVVVNGVFFDEGKQFNALGILNPTVSNPAQQKIQYSSCKGERISQ